MSELKKIAMLESEVEAQVLESMLNQQDIPHVIRTYHDSAYDGLFQGIQGWGYIEAPEENETEIMELLEDLRNQESQNMQ